MLNRILVHKKEYKLIPYTHIIAWFCPHFEIVSKLVILHTQAHPFGVRFCVVRTKGKTKKPPGSENARIFFAEAPRSGNGKPPSSPRGREALKNFAYFLAFFVAMVYNVYTLNKSPKEREDYAI